MILYMNNSFYHYWKLKIMFTNTNKQDFKSWQRCLDWIHDGLGVHNYGQPNSSPQSLWPRPIRPIHPPEFKRDSFFSYSNLQLPLLMKYLSLYINLSVSEKYLDYLNSHDLTKHYVERKKNSTENRTCLLSLATYCTRWSTNRFQFSGYKNEYYMWKCAQKYLGLLYFRYGFLNTLTF